MPDGSAGAGAAVLEGTAPTPGRPAAANPQALLAAAAAGHQASWEELVRRYGGLVHHTVRSFRFQEADTADAVQNTWLRLLERATSITQPERLGGWLATTAARECLAILRRRREIPDEDAVLDRIGTSSTGLASAAVATPDRLLLALETHSALVSALGELPEARRRLIIELFDRGGSDYTQIAAVLGMARGSIGPTRARVLRELRGKLEDRGFGPDIAA
jgi:RNA polymerase sigma factor (sigma-70 family)